MGSLVAAVASYLHIKQRGGRWLIRIDNLDPPREDPTAIRKILHSLSMHGLHPDGDVQYQAEHEQRYARACAALADDLFFCNCARKVLRESGSYPGTCREKTVPREDHAIRIRVDDAPIEYEDECLGIQRSILSKEGGDFIIKRRDSLWGYNLATAVDDGLDISHVLRGRDLLDVTPRQIYLMRKLKLTVPTYAHIPVVCYPDGTKLSKQTHAPALDDSTPARNLRGALAYMGLKTPAEDGKPVEFWLQWALNHWQLGALPAALPAYSSPDGPA
jgi:glutamyl-Q tRNA(Asp) synthetase